MSSSPGQLDQWICENSVVAGFSRLGKPADDARIELFSGNVRDDHLDMHLFLSQDEACDTVESRGIDQKEYRPHRFLAGKAPRAFAHGNQQAGFP